MAKKIWLEPVGHLFRLGNGHILAFKQVSDRSDIRKDVRTCLRRSSKEVNASGKACWAERGIEIWWPRIKTASNEHECHVSGPKSKSSSVRKDYFAIRNEESGLCCRSWVVFVEFLIMFSSSQSHFGHHFVELRRRLTPVVP